MSAGEVRVTNATTGGQKGSKAQRFDLVPLDAVAAIAEVYDFGSKKYADDNWRLGYQWSLSFSALMRHLTAFWEGVETDEESGLPHLAHAGFHVLALLTFSAHARYAELDDRPHKRLAALEAERDAGGVDADVIHAIHERWLEIDS